MPAPTTAFLIFGRFQPPTKGHERLFKEAAIQAQRVEGQVFVFPSQTADKKNPLTYEEKVALIQPSMRSVRNFHIGPKSVKTPYDAISWCRDHGFSRITLYVGDDRLTDFRQLASTWRRQEDPNKTVAVQIKSMPRTGAMDASLVSGTVARRAAQTNDFAAFQQVLIGSVSLTAAKRAMQAIRRALGPLKEWNMEFEIRMTDEQEPLLTEEEQHQFNNTMHAVFEMGDDEEDEDDATSSTKTSTSNVTVTFDGDETTPEYAPDVSSVDMDEEERQFNGTMHAVFETEDEDEEPTPVDDSPSPIVFEDDEPPTDDPDHAFNGTMHAVFELDETDEDPAIKDETLGAVNAVYATDDEGDPIRYPTPGVTVEKEPTAVNKGGRVPSDTPKNKSVVVINPKRHLRHDLAVKASSLQQTGNATPEQPQERSGRSTGY